MDLTDQQWNVILPLLPPVRRGRGRPALDFRRFLDGIFWKIRTGSTWRDIPSCYPSHQTCYRWYAQWKSSGLLEKILSSLFSDLLVRGKTTPRLAIAENRIIVKAWGKLTRVYISPRYGDDWRTQTALLLTQIAVQKVREATLQNTGRRSAK